MTKQQKREINKLKIKKLVRSNYDMLTEVLTEMTEEEINEDSDLQRMLICKITELECKKLVNGSIMCETGYDVISGANSIVSKSKAIEVKGTASLHDNVTFGAVGVAKIRCKEGKCDYVYIKEHIHNGEFLIDSNIFYNVMHFDSKSDRLLWNINYKTTSNHNTKMLLKHNML